MGIIGHEPHIASNSQHHAAYTKEDITTSTIWPNFVLLKSDTLFLKLLEGPLKTAPVAKTINFAGQLLRAVALLDGTIDLK